MENESSNVRKMTILTPKQKQQFLSPNKSTMRDKKKQSSRQTSPIAHGETTTISPDTRLYSSGQDQEEKSNNEKKEGTSFKTNDQTGHPLMTEKEKDSKEDTYVQHKDRSFQSISSFDFDSTNEDQDVILPTSRVQEINNKEQMILEMEQSIDINTTAINRLSKKIKVLEAKVNETYDHPDITSKNREAKMKVRNEQKDILSKLDTLDDSMAKLINDKNVAFEKIRDMKQQLLEIKDDIEQHDKYIIRNRENISQLTDDVRV